MKYSKHILKNGTRVIMAPMQETETVTVQILVQAGSRNETIENNGVSHFLEHLFFKGTKRRPSYKIINELLDGTGGISNAYTSKEETGYYIKTPAKKIELALDIMSDAFHNSLLRQSDIDVERGVILQEKSMYLDLPQRYVWDIFEGMLFPNEAMGFQIIGLENVIQSIRRKNFVDYLSQNYRTTSTVVVVAGKFDEEKTLKLVEKLFSQKKRRVPVQLKKIKLSQRKPRLEVFEKETDQTHLVIGFHGPNLYSQDRYTQSVLSTILGGGMSSRMFERIREKHGLAYYVSTTAERYTDCGYLAAFAGVKHENINKTIKLILEEFRKIAEKKVSQKELRKAKEQIKGALLMGLESSNSVASFLGEQELYEKKIRKPQDIVEQIDAVSQEEIMNLAQKIIKSQTLNLAAIGPVSKQSNKLKGLLEKF
ncbi:MAG TPA: insulinase family protein [Candidatus Moranbacteria bacterium]|nr:insulinase family protein [Candidatus Moranbacteria bacterium]